MKQTFKFDLNWQVKDIESKLRQRSFLHSQTSNGNSTEESIRPSPHPSHSLTRTKSSSSVNHQKLSPKSQAHPLLKSKSSTYISPDQSESLMYNTKVTLTLRRSNSHLNSPVRSSVTNGNSNESSNYQNEYSKNGSTRCQNYYYFGANPISATSQSNGDSIDSSASNSHQLPKPPLPPASSKPHILQRTVNIIFWNLSPDFEWSFNIDSI